MGRQKIFPESFRFDSDLEAFKIAVDYTMQLIEEKKILIVYGFLKESVFKLKISQEEYEEVYRELSWKDYNEILQSEISVILKQNYDGPIEIEPGLIRYLQEEKIEEDRIQEICDLKLEKRKYVYEKLYSEESKSRYLLKKKTLNHKLSDIKYDINQTVDGEGVLYANIRLKADESLANADLPQSLALLINSNKTQEINFVCDKYDIEYLIDELKTIQKMI